MNRIDLDGKTILVTGGTGSFGRRCCKALLRDFSLKRLVVFSRDETKQFEMMRQLNGERVRYVIGDIRDRRRLLEAADGVDLIIHAAALKQVPQAEYNPYEYVKTNVIGTQNVIEVAREAGVSRVIATSTDKAVNPLNHYGATKLCADKLFIAANYTLSARDIRFACVRMGNLIGSRGSVIPIIRQMSRSGTVTVTDPRMTRFWYDLDEAVAFVIERLRDMRGGEVFVPRTPTMRLTELVEAIAPGVRMEMIGIRPGEKIDEILVSRPEARQTVAFDDYYAVLPDYADIEEYCKASGAKPVDSDFEYTSTDSGCAMSVGQLQAILEREDI